MITYFVTAQMIPRGQRCRRLQVRIKLVSWIVMRFSQASRLVGSILIRRPTPNPLSDRFSIRFPRCRCCFSSSFFVSRTSFTSILTRFLIGPFFQQQQQQHALARNERNGANYFPRSEVPAASGVCYLDLFLSIRKSIWKKNFQLLDFLRGVGVPFCLGFMSRIRFSVIILAPT